MSTAEIVREASEEFEKPVALELDTERRRGTTLHRMNTADWAPDDKATIAQIKLKVRARLREDFADLFAIWIDMVCRLRDYEKDEAGRLVLGADNLPQWARTDFGAYIEDAEKNLTSKQRERYLLQINTSMLEWEERRAEAWFESQMAKAKWEESYALGLDEGPKRSKPTIPEREATGKIESAEARYFAIVATYYSRAADGLVNAMRGIEQRLKDIHMATSGRG